MAIEEAKSPATGPGHDDDAKGAQAVVTGYSTSLSDDEPRLAKAPSDCAFDATEDPELYKPIATYEGAHRWDPNFEWTEQEEKRMIRKVNMKRKRPFLALYGADEI